MSLTPVSNPHSPHPCQTLPGEGAATGWSHPGPLDKWGVREQCINVTIYDQL